jgi:hypothetical protein
MYHGVDNLSPEVKTKVDQSPETSFTPGTNQIMGNARHYTLY